MSEQFPQTPGQIDPSFGSGELLQQQNAVRAMVDARVQDMPAPEWKAKSTAEAFGLEESAYTVYADREVTFGGGFTKIVSKTDPADTLVGISWTSISGNMANPDRSVHHCALRPNGDLVGKVFVENANGASSREITLSAHSADPTVKERYTRQLSWMHDKAQQAMNPPAEAQRSDPISEPESAPMTKKNSLSRWLGRILLR